MKKKCPVIIVDDEKPLLDMLKIALAEEGYDCETFARADSVLEHIPESEADVLVTDITMPGTKGLDLTRDVKRLRPDMSVIVMTGFVSDFTYDTAIEAGASDFIKKPFTIQELLVRIRHVKMQEKVKAMSITDELTGLLNRRGFFALAQQQLKVTNRNRSRMTLLFADMDNFKTINDTLGHQQGDEALSSMADIFRKSFRDSDIIARMSGDEFAIVLIDAPDSNGIVRQRLQKNLDSFNDSLAGRYVLAVSLGMAAYDHDRPCTIDDLLSLADEAMYEEKQRKKSSLAQDRERQETER